MLTGTLATVARKKRSDTADGWAQHVANRGGTYSADTLAALRALDYDLALFDLKHKLVYFNPRCGSDITAARVPMIARFGPGYDVMIGTFAAWTEANGLVNSSGGQMDTGVFSAARGLSLTSLSLGCYLLTDGPSTNYLLGIVNALGLQTSATSGQYIIIDYLRSRVQTDASLLSDGDETKGLICGSRHGAGVAFVARNGVVRGTTSGTSNSNTMGNIRLYAAQGTSAGDFIGQGLTRDDVANLTWILHAFNTALGRQVTAEGLS